MPLLQVLRLRVRTSPRGKGRPRLDDTDVTIPVSTKLTTSQYDAMYRRAAAARVSVAEQVRRDVADAARLARDPHR